MARLFSLAAPIPDDASVLELGCASGGNIIPLAEQMPKARILGVDFSASQIAEGKRIIEALKLTNIELRCMDLQEIGESFGPFDYIICHGVFSWVPEDVRNRILQICRERLSEFGVAYVSYNTYPGWFSRGLIRQAMMPYVSREPDANTRIGQARMLLAFLSETIEGQQSPYANVLRNELELVAKNPDPYLFHEHLEEHNCPMFFHQFIELARNHHLQFLGESILPSMLISNLPIKSTGTLCQLTSDLCEQNQYMDFATNRMFRQSLLCHEHHKLNRHLSHSSLAGGHLAGNFQIDHLQKWNNLHPAVEVIFQSNSRRPIATKDPAVKAMIFSLAEAWPSSLSDEVLRTRTLAKLASASIAGPYDQEAIGRLIESSMIHLVLRGDVALRFLPDRFSNPISDRPKVSALARLQAERGESLTTRRHTMWNADQLTRLMLPAMNGSTTLDELDALLTQLNGGKSGSHDLKKILAQLQRAAMFIA